MMWALKQVGKNGEMAGQLYDMIQQTMRAGSFPLGLHTW